MSDEFKKRQKSLFSEADKERQKDELRKAYENEARRLSSERSACEGRLAELNANKPSSPDELKTWQHDVDQETKKISDIDEKLRTAPEREKLGRECIDSAQIYEGEDGKCTIYSKLGPAQPRLAYEGENRSGLESRTGQQRLHAQGPGTGFESDVGIGYGEKNVNIGYQRDGIEAHFRDRYENRNQGEELWQRTVVTIDPKTREVRSVEYELESGPAGSDKHSRAREFSLEITPRQGQAPTLQATVYSPQRDDHAARHEHERRAAANAMKRDSSPRSEPEPSHERRSERRNAETKTSSIGGPKKGPKHSK